MLRVLWTWFAATLLFLTSSAAMADTVPERRVALVIGNGNYERVQTLENPLNDAEDIGAALERLGFEVTQKTDLGYRDLALSLRDFSRVAEDADVAVIYFAGHGLEIDNQNYLVPVDGQLERAADVPYEAVELPLLVKAVSGAKSLRIVLLDACRDNPFLYAMEDGTTRSLGRGLARFEPEGGVLVSYAARGGTVAYDGGGRNSPYAAALLAHLEEPGLEVGQMFRRVRDTVLTRTGGRQEPFTYGNLPATNVYLKEKEPEVDPRQVMLEAFAAADLEGTVEAWQTFVETFREEPPLPAMLGRAEERLAAMTAPPVVDPRQEMLEAFAQADLLGTVEAWQGFVSRFGTEPPNPAMLERAQERLAALTAPPVVDPRQEMLEAFALADMLGTEDSWQTFIDQHREDPPDPAMLERAEERLAALQTPIVTRALNPVIRTCDGLAGDPLDPELPDPSGGKRIGQIDALLALQACERAVRENPDHMRSLYQLARAQAAAGRMADAFTNLNRAAAGGHTRAQVNLISGGLLER